ncbi:peptide chain release factor N(5)-glutamine methyltransferase [Listeria fleischmannii]|uniref:peptide chain release factor N(5)-glutamine methyltransferase n=1 Tax=Listeria fleischmannii TaxID=1069827 RepID=UPI0016232012|nr:peptide chain release factor N(5)-glutamine methyltransferase [Listeria fleischmannii]MBC1418767.1 peptide chain release factor N(5)-glutamine methyltransferase [Listeria fleischmannii]
MPNNTISSLLKKANQVLSERHLDLNAAEILLETRLKYTRSELWTHYFDELSDEAEEQFQKDFKRYLNGEPVQYILNSASFYGLEFYVDQSVLIPRPETEELVQLAEQVAQKEKVEKVLDICTGSGAIAIALKKRFPSLSVTASDISKEALFIAKKNSEILETEIEYVETDLVTLFLEEKRTFDVILANPPYIAEAERAEMSDYVLKNEPDLALFAENDGLAIYERLAIDLPYLVNETFWIGLEIGYAQGEAVQKLFQKSFPQAEVVIHKDMNKKDRMITCTNMLI